MRWAVVVGLLLVVTLLAGCTDGAEIDAEPGEGGPENGGSGEAGPEDAVLTGEEPAEWDIGHYWVYKTSFGDDFPLVVTEDQGTDWFLDTPDMDTAWFNERDPISYLGSVRKADLAGSQGNERVRYFDFPLEEDKEWTTSWDGVERRVVTVEANETFFFEAYEEDMVVVAYDYGPEVGWFTEVTFFDNETGEEDFSMELTAHETDWQGEVFRWDAEKHLDLTVSTIIMSGASSSFSVQEGVEELWTRVLYWCESDDPELSMFQFLMTPMPVSPGQEFHLAEECMEAEEIQVTEDPVASEWQVWSYIETLEVEEPVVFEVEIWSRSLVVLDVSG